MRGRTELSHRVQLQNRNVLEMTGILSVECFDSNEFIVETPQGFLHIRGRDLHIKSLDLNDQQLSIQGEVNDLSYLQSVEVGKTKRKQSMLGRIFK
ncbi:sporulation protein YabP [Risungbinella massiliensis]|uniref:sporulation protein YabP n=1 Tax=Risungbinella massiliensis TaxID=1329796 RepID=UPI0005CC4613|nr:sporulation protein YabP [Risungbinella massiliensis]